MVCRLIFLILIFPAFSIANYSIGNAGANTSRRFDTKFVADFNKDGVIDHLSCHGTRVVIRDGARTSRLLLNYSLPRPQINHGSYHRPSDQHISGCEVARIKGGHPSIVISSAYSNPAVGMRLPADQIVLYNKGEGSRGGLARFVPQRLGINLEGRDFVFKSAARGVTCTPFPQSIVRRGYNPGVLCFYAGYDGPITRGGSGTVTALLKLEEGTDGRIAAVDLTADSGLPWPGGALGTPIYRFPTVSIGSGSRRYDGLHMMDGAFLDYNSDGLPDLVTVAQHASIRLGTMRYNSDTREGISFSNSKIHQAGPGRMTEFLRVTAFNEMNSSIPHKCLYISGEAPNVWDHVRCYEGGNWTTINLPKNVSAGVGIPGINTISTSNSNLLIRAYDTRNRSLNYFQVTPRPGQVIGYIDRVVNTASGVRVLGWGCQEKVSHSIDMHLYVGGAAGRGGQLIHRFTANQPAGSGVYQRCKTRGAFRFNTLLPQSAMASHGGKKIYIHGIKKIRNAPGGNNLITRSGHFSVPRPGNILGYIDRVTKVSNGVRLQGWACQHSVASSIDIHMYVGQSAFRGGRIVAAFRAGNGNESTVNQRCGAVGSFRFNTVIPASSLKGHKGKTIYLHGIQKYRTGAGKNAAITRSGSFRVP